jgi:hypothetical protein
VRHFLDRADPFLRLDAGVGGAAVDLKDEIGDALARGLDRPPLAAGSSTRTATACRAVSSINPRELALPISSSEVDRTITGRFGLAASRANAASTMPAFMS